MVTEALTLTLDFLDGNAPPRPVSQLERVTIESAVMAGGLGLRRDLPERQYEGIPHWFISSAGFACLLQIDENVAVLCRCWVRPEARGNGAGALLYAARLALAKKLGVRVLEVVLPAGARTTAAYLDRGFGPVSALAGSRLLFRRMLTI
jgi:GNAT superfamily N-acetyltransferase